MIADVKNCTISQMQMYVIFSKLCVSVKGYQYSFEHTYFYCQIVYFIKDRACRLTPQFSKRD